MESELDDTEIEGNHRNSDKRHFIHARMTLTWIPTTAPAGLSGPFLASHLAARLIVSKCLSDALTFILKVPCPWMKIHDVALICLALGRVFHFTS